MAGSSVQAIQLPESVRADLERLVQGQASLRREMDAVVRTVRAALDVPDGWLMTDLAVGFVPPDEREE